MIRTAIDYRPLPYTDRLALRALEAIELVVIHATELPTLATARAFGERIEYAGSQTGNSGHYYIDRDGQLACWVPPERVAHHVRGFNAQSVGIELVNLGRFPNWFHQSSQTWSEAYPEAQIKALISLLNYLCERLPRLRFIAGHDQLDLGHIPATDGLGEVRRKVDPGPLFPWPQVLQCTPLKYFSSGQHA